MMHKYLHDHIIEEIHGAEDYWSKALEHAGTPCGSTFKMMAEMEIEHANALTKMFTKTERPADLTEADYLKMYKEILDCYSDGMGKIEAVKKLYYQN